MKRVFWTFVLLVVAVSVAAGAASMVERMSDNGARAEAEALRDEVRQLRAQLDVCLDRMEASERAFREQEQATESLRSQVDAFEAMDERGVPGDRYQEYLEVFDEYNESLPEWERRGEELRQASETCRELAREHNALADSLAGLVAENELWAEGWNPMDE